MRLTARAWKQKAKEYRAAARLAKAAWQQNERIRRAHRKRIEELEQVIADLLVGAEQRSQSSVDVSVKCRKALGYGQAEVEALLVEYGT